jgi:hypothetical protein
MAKLHKHHIIPKHMGGTDDPSNLIELTPDEHSAAHLKLYEEFGKLEDLCAYYMLGNEIEKFRTEWAKLGNAGAAKKRKEQGFNNLYESLNEKQQKKVRDTIQRAGKDYWDNITPEQLLLLSEKQKKWTATLSKEYIEERGRKGGERCRERGTGSCFDPDLLAIARSNGGKAQGKINAESGHLKRISQERAAKIKSGEIQIPPYIWITNSIVNKRLLVAEFNFKGLPEGWQRGRTQQKKE